MPNTHLLHVYFSDVNSQHTFLLNVSLVSYLPWTNNGIFLLNDLASSSACHKST